MNQPMPVALQTFGRHLGTAPLHRYKTSESPPLSKTAAGQRFTRRNIVFARHDMGVVHGDIARVLYNQESIAQAVETMGRSANWDFSLSIASGNSEL